MLDFNHVLSTPGLDLQSFVAINSAVSGTGSGGQQWQTWRKPRGCKFVYMIGVGGGASGGTGTNTANTSGGGGGGGSGAQASVMIPAFMVPDVLYIQCGQGGRQPATIVTATAGVAGIITYISIEPFTTNPTTNDLFLIASGGSGGSPASTTAGGAGSGGGTAPTIATMPLAGRGFYSLFAGQNGGAGGNGTAGTAGTGVTVPVTGLMVTGGGGGGGKILGTFGAGSVITSPTGGVSTGSSDFFPLTAATPAAATGATPAGIGRDGMIIRNMMMNLGGGGGGAASETSGGIAGAGGNGALGCGGGGAGGSSVTTGVTTLARPGDGGDGFVLIASW